MPRAPEVSECCVWPPFQPTSDLLRLTLCGTKASAAKGSLAGKKTDEEEIKRWCWDSESEEKGFRSPPI